MNRAIPFACLLTLFLNGMRCASLAQELPESVHSQLWGRQGELWHADSRLPDFSYAGYHRGDDPLPNVEVVTDVTRFGASGSDDQDDTDAFRRAIRATKRGAIWIPAGRYVISDLIEINQPGIVLRGAGSTKTILSFPKDLEDVRSNMGETTTGRPTSNYSWSGGFLRVTGRDDGTELARVIEPAQRGERRLQVNRPEDFRYGMSIRIEIQDDDAESLIHYLYAGDPGATEELQKHRRRTDFVARVVEVDDQMLVMDRPLPFAIRLAWQPTIHSYVPTVTEVGIEQLGFEFPHRPYAGHFTERGANAIAMEQVCDCWVRDIRIHNCDSGLFVTGRFCSLEGIVITSTRPRDRQRNSTGHHGIQVTGDDNLVRGFDFQTRFIHDLTVAHCHGNVFCDGRGEDLSLDHHKYAPYANLFTHLDAGAGTQLWVCGGGAALGKHAAAWSTFWMIQANQPLAWPPERFAPDRINLVGLTTDQPSIRQADGRWFEAIPPEQLEPKNLWEAQLANRRRGQPRGNATE